MISNLVTLYGPITILALIVSITIYWFTSEKKKATIIDDETTVEITNQEDNEEDIEYIENVENDEDVEDDEDETATIEE